MGCINCKLLSKLKKIFTLNNSPIVEEKQGEPKEETTEKIETSVSLSEVAKQPVSTKLEILQSVASRLEKRDVIEPLNTIQNSCVVSEEVRVEDLDFSRLSNEPNETIRPNTPEDWQSI